MACPTRAHETSSVPRWREGLRAAGRRRTPRSGRPEQFDPRKTAYDRHHRLL
jgi:hypothetical protein